MKKLFYLLPFLLVLISCKKDPDLNVKYEVSGSADNGYKVIYYDGGEVKVTENKVYSGWTFSFEAVEGQEAYIHATSLSPSSTVKVVIRQGGDIVDEDGGLGDYPTAHASAVIE